MLTDMYNGGLGHVKSVELLCSSGTAERVADPMDLTLKED